MPWTAEHLQTLYTTLYANRLDCPACGGRLTLIRSADGVAVGQVRCENCNAGHLVTPQSDPLRGKFRDYTDDERKQMIAADRQRKDPVCPVDGTTMIVHAQRSLGRTSNVTIRCWRCRHSIEFVRTSG